MTYYSNATQVRSATGPLLLNTDTGFLTGIKYWSELYQSSLWFGIKVLTFAVVLELLDPISLSPNIF